MIKHMQERYHDYMFRRLKEERDIPVYDDKWDKRFMEMTKLISTWSKDPSTKIGAIIVNDDRRILATGYNGFPRGIQDTEERLNNRKEKYPRIIHAEMNALMNALYNGVSIKDSTLYVYGLPVCSECTKSVIQAGIKRVVIPNYASVPLTWQQQWDDISEPMFKESGVQITYLEL